jgi:hypothetical protein
MIFTETFQPVGRAQMRLESHAPVERQYATSGCLHLLALERLNFLGPDWS